MENAKLHTIRNANCKYSFDSAPLHHNTSFFPSPRLPLSHSPSLPDSFSISPFPNNLRNHFPPIRSVLDKTKILQFCIDNEAFQDCTFVKRRNPIYVPEREGIQMWVPVDYENKKVGWCQEKRLKGYRALPIFFDGERLMIGVQRRINCSCST